MSLIKRLCDLEMVEIYRSSLRDNDLFHLYLLQTYRPSGTLIDMESL